MTDTKHLDQRRQRWFYRRAIPETVRRKFPDRIGAIEVSLATDSLTVAQRRRAIIGPRVETMLDKAGAGHAIKAAELDALRSLFGRRGALTDAAAQRLELEALHSEHDYLWRDPLISPDMTRMMLGQAAGHFAPLADWLKANGQDVKIAEAIRADDEEAARATLKAAGIEATETAVAKVAEGIAKARARALLHWDHKRELPPRPDAPVRRSSSGRAPRVSEAAKAYIEFRQRDPAAALKPQTVAQMKSTYRLFAEHVRDARLDEVTDDDALSFLDTIARLHRDYGHRLGVKELSLAELLKRYPADDGEGPTNKTLNRHQSALKTLFTWASSKKGGKLLDADAPNPFKGLWRKPAKSSKVKYQHFEADELTKLFKGARFEQQPKTLAAALPWIMAIGLYSGMRVGEICKLDGGDLKREGRIWYFDLIAAKTEAGVRQVPIHSKLIDLGLLDLAKASGTKPLFGCITPTGPKDGETRGQTVSNRFSEYRRERGVNRERGHEKGRVAFHSFRKNMERALELADVQQHVVKQIIGHEREFTSSTYNPQGLPLSALRDAVEAVKYPGLKPAR